MPIPQFEVYACNAMKPVSRSILHSIDIDIIEFYRHGTYDHSTDKTLIRESIPIIPTHPHRRGMVNGSSMLASVSISIRSCSRRSVTVSHRASPIHHRNRRNRNRNRDGNRRNRSHPHGPSDTIVTLEWIILAVTRAIIARSNVIAVKSRMTRTGTRTRIPENATQKLRPISYLPVGC